MSCNISSSKIENPLLVELLKTLTDYFRKINADFFVIGATARDIILSNIFDEMPRRKTADLDIAIAIPDWSKFEQISLDLETLGSFVKSTKQKQRFIFKGEYLMDIVPFGGVEKDDQKILWPPDEQIGMSTLGFAQVAKHTMKVTIDNDFAIYVATLPGIFLLKLAAWNDRNLETNKDAEDMAYIISVYLSINQERAVNVYYHELYEVANFDPFIAGGVLLAYDINMIIGDTPIISNKFSQIIALEINKEDGSRLINQMIETNLTLKYLQVTECLKCMVQIIE
jgi:predicted nucleotidyltransferase